MKFAQMSTKKLNALLETASEEDAVAIKAILESRNAQQAEAGAGEGTELSEEEKQAIAAAEKASAPEGDEPAGEEKKKGVARPVLNFLRRNSLRPRSWLRRM